MRDERLKAKTTERRTSLRLYPLTFTPYRCFPASCWLFPVPYSLFPTVRLSPTVGFSNSDSRAELMWVIVADQAT
jgi:hypothetical protein